MLINISGQTSEQQLLIKSRL